MEGEKREASTWERAKGLLVERRLDSSNKRKVKNTFTKRTFMSLQSLSLHSFSPPLHVAGSVSAFMQVHILGKQVGTWAERAFVFACMHAGVT